MHGPSTLTENSANLGLTMRIEIYAATRTQQGRPQNEDAFLIGRDAVPYVVLCDGAGNAERAAKRAIKQFEVLLKECWLQRGTGGGNLVEMDTPARLRFRRRCTNNVPSRQFLRLRILRCMRRRLSILSLHPQWGFAHPH